MAKRNKGFTLIELLVVMAISVILMGLVLYPVAQSFMLTRRAQAMVDAQDAARTAMQMISRELGQAMYVFDNAQEPFVPFATDLPNGVNNANCQTPIMLPVTQPNGSTTWFVLPFAKIDFIMPKLYMHCNNDAHPPDQPRDYPRDIQVVNGGSSYTELRDWPSCPYCNSNIVEARPKLPLEQDVTVVRYFLGLRNNILGAPIVAGGPDNAGWVSPWGKNVVDGTENQVVLYRVEFDPHDDTLFPAAMPVNERLSDPVFFYRPGEAAAWAKKARIVGIGKYEDLVTATFDNNDNVTAVHPTITFRTASIENDPFVPAMGADKLSEYPTAPATVFSGSYGYWCPGSRIEVLRGNYCDDPPGGIDYYTKIESGDLVVMRRVPAANNSWDETVEFNISQYRADGFVPADRSGQQPLEMAYNIDENKGTAIFALQPPRENMTNSGPVCIFDPEQINGDFHSQYNVDRYGARRNVQVKTLAVDPSGAPLFPNQYLKNARIVPGSEKVIGPDMIVGPHFGQPIRYERIPLGLRYPAQNQYQIDCDTGWIMFTPDPSLNLPEMAQDQDGNDRKTWIHVYYLIYFNQNDDVVRGDYLTKSLIDVQLGMRMFDPDKGIPYPVDLSDSVKVRNALR